MLLLLANGSRCLLSTLLLHCVFLVVAKLSLQPNRVDLKQGLHEHWKNLYLQKMETTVNEIDQLLQVLQCSWRRRREENMEKAKTRMPNEADRRVTTSIRSKTKTPARIKQSKERTRRQRIKALVFWIFQPEKFYMPRQRCCGEKGTTSSQIANFLPMQLFKERHVFKQFLLFASNLYIKESTPKL